MKKSFLLFFALILGTSTINAQDISINSDKAIVKFNFVKEKTEGTVKGIKADITFDKSNLSNSTISGSANIKTISTGNKSRDQHLLSDEFFDVVKYPTIKFTSSNITKKEDLFVMTGKLTMKDVTKDITIKFKYDGKMFKGKTVVYTNDYGVFKPQADRKDSKVVVSIALPVAK